jgi:hypothetical protein
MDVKYVSKVTVVSNLKVEFNYSIIEVQLFNYSTIQVLNFNYSMPHPLCVFVAPSYG